MRAALILGLIATPAMADSPDAWEAFRTQVETACLALVPEQTGQLGEPAVEVNPFGSESYGAAIVTVTFEAGADRMVCILEKATGEAELTSPWVTPTE